MARTKNTPRKASQEKTKPKKNAPGECAPRKASDYVRSTLILDKRVFKEIVQDLSIKVGHDKDMDIKYTSLALMATQEATEHFITSLLVEASYIAALRKDTEISRNDIAVARRMLLREL